ncbi:putative multidrug export ATP-binding/permease protein [bacterium BMS3Abin02]|nr:putative multidrug export ATP-binding/permease protein [bacterium BMS3Abin02]GBE22544.1 putative multidrug export ATP-binding/permease protein [bacterium BMS3Bbin01]
MMYSRYGGEHEVDRPFRLLVRAARYGRPLLGATVWALLLTVLATLARLAVPLIMRSGIDGGVMAGDVRVILLATGVYLGVLVAQYFTQRFSVYQVAAVGERYLRDLRVRLFRHMMSLDIAFFTRSKVGVLVSRMTSDVEALTAFVDQGAISVITSGLMVVGVTIAMFLIDTTLAWTVLALLPALVAVSVVFRKYANRAYEAIREQIGRVLGTLQEGISGVRVVQAYTQERRQAIEFGRVNQKYFEANLQAAKAIASYFPSVDFIATVGTGLVLLVGARRVLTGELSFGSLVAFLLYLGYFFDPIVQLSNVYNLLQAALAALSKLFGILDTEPDLAEAPEPVHLPDGACGEVAFENVTFGYDPDLPVLHDVNLRLRCGERLAIVGETGAGKSTVAKLAIRFYDPTKGRITLDGVDLRDLDYEELRRSIAMVPQEGFLFAGSLRDNLAFARPGIDDETLWRICETVGIASWVRSLPERLDTDVRERGSRLSSGERQLVALARALVADPAVIVLDEATSNLDPETEGIVEAALDHLLKDRTAIVIAHRLRTAERADRVIVIDGGRIVEEGSHEELLKVGGAYAHLNDVWKQGVGTQ